MISGEPHVEFRDPDKHYRIARKIAGNERLTDEDRVELRRNLEAVTTEMRAIFMRERRWEQ